MAEAALSAIVQAAFERLASPVLKEFGMFKALHKDTEKLGRTLSTILAVLKDAEEKQLKNNELKTWLKQLKRLAYDADDALDQCTTEASRRQLETQGRGIKVVSNLVSASNRVMFRYHMAHKIKEIGERLDEIADERLKFHLRLGESHLEFISPEEMDSHVTESGVKGREEDRKRIVELLLNMGNKEKVSVISIIGIGGMGKTTLAQLAYHDARVEKHFDLRMWVYVSYDFNVMRLTQKIIESAKKSEVNLKSMESLQLHLREMLHGKKFLLVLDDVWNKDSLKWERLKSFVQAGETGSKILVTTRSEEVNSIMGTVSPHYLRRLSEDNCWSLFEERAFKRGQEQNPKLVVLGKEIVKKCGGVPLAAKALGSLMCSKRDESEWQYIKQNEIWNLPEVEKDILPVLKLSYYQLPSQLKECFAYCANFPKDYFFETEELIQLWMAEGFIQSSQGNKLLEVIGREYFNSLIWLSFFRDAEKDDDDNVVRSKMHDLMHDLAKSVSEDSYSLVSEDDKIIVPDGCRRLSVEIRRLGQDSLTLMPSDNAKKLRTLLAPTLPSAMLSCKIFAHSPCLRVLDLRYVDVTEDILNSISQLKQLRYLHLSIDDSVQILPNSLSQLHNLQTLRLRGCGFLEELPTDMRKMTSLRHLQIDSWKSLTHMPAKIGGLKFLQTLPVFLVGKDEGCNIRELQHLNHLKGELNIRKLENVSDEGNAREAKLSEKANVRTLRFSWGDYINAELRDGSKLTLEGLQPHPNVRCLEVENYAGKTFPKWMSSSCLPNLVHISLINCRGWEQEQLPPLGQFGLLRFLHLSGMHAVKRVGSQFDGDDAFPLLKELILEDMPSLEEWSGRNGRQVLLPCLESLTVSGCPKLITMPSISALRSLRIENFENSVSLPECLFQSHQIHLSKIIIKDCPKVESLSKEFGSLSTLDELSIQRCNKLGSLFPEETQNHLGLRRLEIDQCDGLTSLRLHYTSLTALESLKIYDCRELGSLPDGMEHLTSLKTLHIENCYKLTSLPEGLKHAPVLQEVLIGGFSSLAALPEWIGSLSSLQHLRIYGCHNLERFSGGMHHLTALESLEIRQCPQLVSLPEGMELLTSLRYLSIGSCDKVRDLPEGLKHATGLEQLNIEDLPSVAALPEWIGDLSSLRYLCIRGCRNLVCLPSRFQHLKSLQHLRIFDCPQLERRCRKDSGEDWHKIAHIPQKNVIIGWGRRQSHGHMLDMSRRFLNKLIPTSSIRRRNVN